MTKNYKKKPNGKNATGAPTKLTEELIKKLEALLDDPQFIILTDEEICIHLDINDETKARWLDDKSTELSKKFYGLIKKARTKQKMNLSERIGTGDNGWQGSAWIAERKFEDLRLVQILKGDLNNKVKLEGKITIKEETKKRLDELIQ
jgi:hypothetical protein